MTPNEDSEYSSRKDGLTLQVVDLENGKYSFNLYKRDIYKLLNGTLSKDTKDDVVKRFLQNDKDWDKGLKWTRIGNGGVYFGLLLLGGSIGYTINAIISN